MSVRLCFCSSRASAPGKPVTPVPGFSSVPFAEAVMFLIDRSSSVYQSEAAHQLLARRDAMTATLTLRLRMRSLCWWFASTARLCFQRCPPFLHFDSLRCMRARCLLPSTLRRRPHTLSI